jgi:hypothetical protein
MRLIGHPDEQRTTRRRRVMGNEVWREAAIRRPGDSAGCAKRGAALAAAAPMDAEADWRSPSRRTCSVRVAALAPASPLVLDVSCARP